MIVFRYKNSESGQALVESAIILPLFIFILLGILQMGLIYQARYLLKYAAYRSARTGALLHANKKAMKEAALSVLAPVIGTGDGYSKTDNFANYSLKFGAVSLGEGLLSAVTGSSNISLLKVVVCGPTKQHLSTSGGYSTFKVGEEVEFDAYENMADSSWQLNAFERTKLRIQLQYYHQLVIPFANVIIFRSWMGLKQLEILRMQRSNGLLGGYDPSAPAQDRADASALIALAALKKVFLPLHANYAFRMQSNLYPNSGKEELALPQDNQCWHYEYGKEGDL